MTTEEELRMKAWIDNASYVHLLERWRCAPGGSPWFAGAIGVYYVEVMARRRAEVGDAAHVQASKDIGWESRG